jgi:hypothetical protein
VLSGGRALTLNCSVLPKEIKNISNRDLLIAVILSPLLTAGIKKMTVTSITILGPLTTAGYAS